MEIVDRRTFSSAVPAVKILNKIIPLIGDRHLRKTRNIVLIDWAYRRSNPLTRYNKITGTGKGDIEIYIATMVSRMSNGLKSNQILWTILLTQGIMQEIYHHSLRGNRLLRRLIRKNGEDMSGDWAAVKAREIVEKLYPPDEYGDQLRDIHSRIRTIQELQFDLAEASA
jgi:hypothetical protein